MNILIVGAGAVGQVYGYHFQRSGHNVSYLIKEKYQQQLDQGMVLYHLNRDKKLQNPLSFNHYQLLCDWPQHDAHNFDLIVLTIPSNALRQLPFDKILACTQGKVPLLMLQPSEADLEILRSNIPGQVIAEGLISLIAYQTPLLDDHNPALSQIPQKEGIAYYLPPMSMPVSSTDQSLAKKLAQVFHQSGIKAKPSHSAIDDSKLPSAFLMTFLCCLEAADWQLQKLAKSPDLLQDLSAAQRFYLPGRLSSAAGRSLFTVVSQLFLRPWFYKVMIRLAPVFVPLPLEAYLKFHFGKVRTQTLLYMRDYITQTSDQRLIRLLEKLEPY